MSEAVLFTFSIFGMIFMYKYFYDNTNSNFYNSYRQKRRIKTNRTTECLFRK